MNGVRKILVDFDAVSVCENTKPIARIRYLDRIGIIRKDILL